MPVFNFGSGGTGLSIKVNAYSSFPTTASENTVGIITNKDVSGYKCSSTQPTTDLKDGLVWIKTGSESSVHIPVDARGNVTIYPLCAKQYDSDAGAWVNIDSSNVKCYQSGTWNVFDRLIYDNGTTYYPLTFNNTTATYGGSYISLTAAGSISFYTSSLMDVSEYGKLSVTLAHTGGGGTLTYARVGLYSTTTASYSDDPDVSYTSVAVGTSTDVVTVNHSLTQTGSNYAPGAHLRSTNGTPAWNIYKIWLTN